MGGMSGVVKHIKICDDVAVGAHTLITKDIKEPGNYIGTMPTQDKKSWAKSSIFIKKEVNMLDVLNEIKILPHRDPFLFIDEIVNIELAEVSIYIKEFSRRFL